MSEPTCESFARIWKNLREFWKTCDQAKVTRKILCAPRRRTNAGPDAKLERYCNRTPLNSSPNPYPLVSVYYHSVYHIIFMIAIFNCKSSVFYFNPNRMTGMICE